MGKDKRKKTKGVGKLKKKIEKIKDDMVSDYIITFENKYKRQPTQEEIDKMYERAQKVVTKNARRFGIRVAAIVSVMGITGGAIAFLNNDDTKALPEGQKQEQEIEKEETKTKEQSFREGQKVLSEEEKIANEINGLETVADIDRYLNNIYIEAYEEIYGETELTTSDIQIDESSQNYVYELDDGQMVTHGKFPNETEKQLELDGQSFTATDEEVKIYTVKKDGKIIDAVTKLDFQKVIAGDNYQEMKDSESVLIDIKDITKTAFRLKEVIQSIEKNPEDEGAKKVKEVVQEKLAELVVEYNEQKQAQTIDKNQIQVNQENDRELGE